MVDDGLERIFESAYLLVNYFGSQQKIKRVLPLRNFNQVGCLHPVDVRLRLEFGEAIKTLLADFPQLLATLEHRLKPLPRVHFQSERVSRRIRVFLIELTLVFQTRFSLLFLHVHTLLI